MDAAKLPQFRIGFTLATDLPDLFIGNTKLPVIADLIELEKNGENLPIFLAILDDVIDLAFGSLVLDFSVTPVEPAKEQTCGPLDHRCHLADKKMIASSNLVRVQRCSCGEYFLTDGQGTHRAKGTEKALAELVDSLIKLKLPGAIPGGIKHG